MVEAYSGDLSGLLAGGHVDAALIHRPVDADGQVAADLLSEGLVPEPRGERWRVGEVAGMRLILPSRLH